MNKQQAITELEMIGFHKVGNAYECEGFTLELKSDGINVTKWNPISYTEEGFKYSEWEQFLIYIK